MVRQDNIVPSRRFREDGLEYLKLSRRGGGGARVNTHGAPAVAKQTKPINSDSMQVQAEPVVSIPRSKAIQIFEATGHAQCFRRILFLPDFHGHYTGRGARFLLGFSMYLIFGSNGSGIPDFGICPIYYVPSTYIYIYIYIYIYMHPANIVLRYLAVKHLDFAQRCDRFTARWSFRRRRGRQPILNNIIIFGKKLSLNQYRLSGKLPGLS